MSELIALRHSQPCVDYGFTVAAIYDEANDTISIGVSLQNKCDRYSRKAGRQVALDRARTNPYLKFDAKERYGAAIAQVNQRGKRVMIEAKVENTANDIFFNREHYIAHLNKMYRAEEAIKEAAKQKKIDDLRAGSKKKPTVIERPDV